MRQSTTSYGSENGRSGSTERQMEVKAQHLWLTES